MTSSRSFFSTARRFIKVGFLDFGAARGGLFCIADDGHRRRFVGLNRPRLGLLISHG